MKEQIRDMILEGGWTDGDYETPEKIESFVFDFMDWVRNNCYKHLHLWGIGDDESGVYYGNAELYDYWLKSKSSIPMLPVKSSQINSVGWQSGTLFIEFNKGTVYSYDRVPESFFEALKKAESVGKYFAAQIKGKFEFEKTDKVVVNNELK
jgi:hypothetical protein